MAPPNNGNRSSWQRMLAMAAVLVATACLMSAGVSWLRGLSGPRPVIHMPLGESEAFNGDESTEECRGRVVFPRAKIPAHACEGYWRDGPKVDPYDAEGPAPLPFPEQRPLPFCGQHLWTKRLLYLETRAKEDERGKAASSGIDVTRTRGLSPSRLTEELLGNLEYSDSRAQTCWTGDFREHYVERFNVAPSREFYDYVLAAYDRVAPSDD